MLIDVDGLGSAATAALASSAAKRYIGAFLVDGPPAAHADVGSALGQSDVDRQVLGTEVQQARDAVATSSSGPPALGETFVHELRSDQQVGHDPPAVALVPASARNDALDLVTQANTAAQRSQREAAYAASAAEIARRFYRLAAREAKTIWHDPPISVAPTADVFPFYSAVASPVLSVLVPVGSGLALSDEVGGVATDWTAQGSRLGHRQTAQWFL